MIIVALSQLLGRGVRLDTAEALAVAQSAAGTPGIPTIENVEVASDGSARCIIGGATPTVAAYAAFLDALLPPSGVPAPLRYTVARGLGAVEAPLFASVEDFAVALRRFETGDRAQVVRQLLGRSARLARPIVPTSGPDPAGEAVLPPLVTVPPRRPRSRAPLVAAALFLSAIAGFAGAALMRPHLTPLVPSPAASATRPSSAIELTAEPSAPPSPRATSGDFPAPAAPAARVQPKPVTAPASLPQLARALPADESPAFSPAFSSNGTALFFQTGGPRDGSSAIAVAATDGAPDDDLRVMKVVDDGARNYHAQPSPGGRQIAFDSDRDGERGIYVANRDGSDVHRISGPGYAALPTWSPDGSRLAYVRGEVEKPDVWNLWIQPLDGGAPRRVTSYRYGQTWSASWFPDGRRIAYSHEETLTILDLVTGETRQFATPLRGRLVRTPAVSPDGSRIVFQVFRAGAWMLNLADGSMQCVLADPTAEEFAWAPDGHRFAFHSRRSGQWGVYVLSGVKAVG